MLTARKFGIVYKTQFSGRKQGQSTSCFLLKKFIIWIKNSKWYGSKVNLICIIQFKRNVALIRLCYIYSTPMSSWEWMFFKTPLFSFCFIACFFQPIRFLVVTLFQLHFIYESICYWIIFCNWKRRVNMELGKTEVLQVPVVTTKFCVFVTRRWQLTLCL